MQINDKFSSGTLVANLISALKKDNKNLQLKWLRWVWENKSSNLDRLER